MEPSREHVCPSCSATADENQRWCLECGAELPHKRRSAVRPVVGIATTLTVLVGAASAAGFTLLQDGTQPPPPATTIAQQAPPVTPPPVDTTAVPPADTTLPDTSADTTLPDTAGGGAGGAASSGGGSTGGGSSSGGGSSAPPANPVPDLSDDVDTSTPNPPPPDDDAGDVDSGSGSVQDESSGDDDRTQRRETPPPLVDTNIALGAVAVPYAPYASGDEDLGDAGAAVDGNRATAWQTPPFDDPAAHPQLGIYVDLASPERLTKLVLATPTPGMSFEVYTATSGPPKSITAAGWSHLATKEGSPGKTTIELPDGTRARYVLVWVTGLPQGRDHAAISELQIFSKQPR